jgi:periplasmic copper chaperone A
MSIRICATVLAAAFTAISAAAHVVAEPNKGPAGGYFRTFFRVTHGCHGSPTIAVRITIPDGVQSVKA